jgi:adenine phosphoribosyltransferase
MEWPAEHEVKLYSGADGELVVKLPLVTTPDGFSLYALDLMGRTKWNARAAESLVERLAAFDFDRILTAESKAIALTQELAARLGQRDYVVLRKSRKLYMKNPVQVDVQSITTTKLQQFYLGKDQVALLEGKRVCVVDDVISTGGTAAAIFKMAKVIGFEVVVIAVVLTEETPWTTFQGVPVVSLAHIPLPGNPNI